ncbi:unnamed protein product [Paramecium primaurelia]|uniref:Uncharacterized protein n=1 Tax=Paramecium primaurelia TaxID=5886 RepID=A0A8S1Q7G9_PARPR|nr:unnamed protein product [Paramecium primaurelia]
MFPSLNSIKKPKKSFNLLHLETQEQYFLSLKVALIPSAKSDEIRGKLHLCSRSLVFEPKSSQLPLMKMKYSNGLFMKVLKNFEPKSLSLLLSIRWGYQLLQEDIDQLDLASILNQQKGEQKSNELLEKLYNKQRKNMIQLASNCFFIKVDKLFIVNRNPISPYITEICDDNIVFTISKSNSKQILIRFLKLYQGINQAEDEFTFINQTIQQTLNDSLLEHKSNLGSEGHKIEFVHKVKLIKPEGVIFGLFSIQKEEILQFIPLINSPKGKIMQFMFTDIKYFLKYRYMFKNNGIEFWMYNKKRSYLFVFDDSNTQESVFKYFQKKASKHCLSALTKEKISQEWINGNMSNFDYLMALNTLANRSFNDLSAYPVFPWIIAEYNEKEFNINQPTFFRDLSKPMGALNKHRLQKYKAFYKDQLKDKQQDPKPYLYPTHYSSPGTVVYYMIRKIPEFVIKLQNGVFGPTDRIFRGIDSTWFTTLNLHADSKELIPEFYGLDSDFLINCDKLELGITQDGEVIDDAVIPAWAENAVDFLAKMRIALESPYVQVNLPQWIDLIFGSKSSGNEALLNDNLFYPYTYAENVNWDKCKTDIERQALEIQVTEFGQVPLQLFQTAHPQRKLKIQGNLKQLEDEKKELKQLNQTLQNQIQKLTQQIQQTQDKEVVTQLQTQLAALQWENEKLKFNLETFKQEVMANKEIIQTFNSQFDQEEFDKNGFDFLNDDSLLDSSKKANQ